MQGFQKQRARGSRAEGEVVVLKRALQAEGEILKPSARHMSRRSGIRDKFEPIEPTIDHIC